MKARVLLVALLLVTANQLHAQKIKVIVDQDARGPATTDMQSILIFLQSEKFDVLGITTVSGDQWVKEETQRTLRLLEIAGRNDVPVTEGAEFPLLNSKEETERWEALYGKFRYKGCWSDFSDRPATTPPAFRAGYHEPDVIPPLVEGSPHTKPLDETAAHFIVRMVHKYPGEVVVWAGGPLTNIALALRLDPEVATLAKELVLMGSGMYADNGGISGVDGRREFNWWFDPEAVRITMRAPWKKITITPIDISVKTKLGPEIRGRSQKRIRRWLATSLSFPSKASCGMSFRPLQWWIRRSSPDRKNFTLISILTTGLVTVRRCSGIRGQQFLHTSRRRRFSSMWTRQSSTISMLG
jgi:purine nucleosidase